MVCKFGNISHWFFFLKVHVDLNIVYNVYKVNFPIYVYRYSTNEPSEHRLNKP